MSDDLQNRIDDLFLKYKKLEQRRKDDIHFLVMVLSLILPATYRDILYDLGADEYVNIYALQDLINREKYHD